MRRKRIEGMKWQELRVKIASVLLVSSIAVNIYGIVALMLFKYNALLLLGYMGLAVLTIPVFVLVQFLSPANTRQKSAVERNRNEGLFIKLYDTNLMLAVGVWVAIIVVFALKEEL
jgi:hypothetical protein